VEEVAINQSISFAMSKKLHKTTENERADAYLVEARLWGYKEH